MAAHVVASRSMSVPTERVAYRTLWWVGLLTIGATIAANLLIYAIAALAFPTARDRPLVNRFARAD